MQLKRTFDAPILVITPSVPAVRHGDSVYLDDKALAGLLFYSEYWPGRVRCIFRSGANSAIAFGSLHPIVTLPFEVSVIPEGSVISDEHLLGAAVILASGDNWLDLPIAEQGKRLGIPVCFVIEYTLMTRIRIAIVSEISLARLIKTIVWNLLKEGQRRSAFKKGAALQANGVPAEKAYRSHTGNLLMFLDTRLSASQMAIPKEVNRKIERLKSGAPIRLVFTGRLERIKGADHLIEVARRINVPFSLDIFGDGGLRESILDAVRRENLENCVHIHGPVDFATRLVPLLRTEADVFLCCHVQADPSCTYLETLGCGVPILGYSNEAWAGLLHLSGAGWSVPVGRPDLMAKKIGEMHHDRGVLGKKIEMGISFARVHSFESEFKRRVDHLTTLSDLTP